ncbi:telomerase protein component 1 isoform X2 [Polyodon spathula]|uniref:telomerase protein component 1 isoform X2 n=1 Tax=Polyodon spathula TaxID=7913 RepID=UPI001B7DC53E|nr:telomerase protein component 1 isoform X2 [Polyodon spathula]
MIPASCSLENRLLSQPTHVSKLSLENPILACVPLTTAPSTLLKSPLLPARPSCLDTPFQSASRFLCTAKRLLSTGDPGLSKSLHSSVSLLTSRALTPSALLQSSPLRFTKTGAGVQAVSLLSKSLEDHPQSHEEQPKCAAPSCQDVQDPRQVAEEMPVYDLWDNEKEEEKEEREQTEALRELQERGNSVEEQLRGKKLLMLNAVCCSLINRESLPTQADLAEAQSTWSTLKTLAEEISQHDAEFTLKVAVYTRQELNIRYTANFLLALAAHLPSCRPHLHRYFSSAVQLPSDWIEVARTSSTCFGSSLPSCLRRAMTDKFKQFSEFQLAKYNTRKMRCKHRGTKTRGQGKGEQESKATIQKWANSLCCDDSQLKCYLQSQTRAPAQKQQDQFNMKKLIQKLHIKEPAHLVMGLLRRRYPSDLQAFFRSGLSGPWDSQRAGQRMKLQQPETWERSLCEQGNEAGAWENLIDKNKLPFMAMLRNLRNMIRAGISEAHHTRVINRLTSKKLVMNSRQFPFRFLSAYKVIQDLEQQLKEAEKQKLSSSQLLREILEKVPKRKTLCQFSWASAGRKRLRRTLAVPFVYRQVKNRKSQQLKAGHLQFDKELLHRYRCALETSIQLSCRYNVPPLPGHTLLLCSAGWEMLSVCQGTKGLCCFSGSEQGTKQGTTVQEVAVLLALMMAHASEHAQLYLFDQDCKEVELQQGEVLENVGRVIKQIEDLKSQSPADPLLSLPQLFFNLTAQRIKVDTVVVLGSSVVSDEFRFSLQRYQREVNPHTLLVKVLLDSRDSKPNASVDLNCVELHGFSEQILKFVAERGSSRLLDHIHHIDELYNIPPQGGTTGRREEAVEICCVPPTPRNRWRSVRVFVSSTFRDMHGERDLLVRSVFPELRLRAARLCVSLQEVDLRWGITEEESNRAVELCLTEVSHSQLFVGILGERYGLVPGQLTLPDLPHFRWLQSAPPGRSITELEILQFQNQNGEAAPSRMFLYLRNPQLLRSVPQQWEKDFAAESEEARKRMADLKSRLLNSGVPITENYPCEWGGVSAGKPFVKGLEEFGKKVLSDLWGALLDQFAQEEESSDTGSEVTAQEVFQEWQQRQFYGRRKLLAMATQKLHELGKGGLFIVPGGAGEGKTVFLASLVNELKSPTDTAKPSTDVTFYFTGASQSAKSAGRFLRYLVQSLSQRLGQEVELATSYRALLLQLEPLLQRACKAGSKRPLVILVDGADLLENEKGLPSSDWIPQSLPQRVTLVLSVSSDSALHRSLARRKDAVEFPLGPLSLLDKREMVEHSLAAYGKKLSDSAFNNQIRVLLMKKGSQHPLYLRLACEEIRAFGVFEKIKEGLQSLPLTLTQLLQHVLAGLEQSCGAGQIAWALAALGVSRTGLRERDLYSLLTMCKGLGPDPVTWQEVMRCAESLENNLVPMATFSHLMRGLQSVIGQWDAQNPDSRLCLTNSQVRSAFEQKYLKRGPVRQIAHLITAALLWKLSDPEVAGSFRHCDPDALVELPFHLVHSGQLDHLHSLLTSYDFLYLHVKLGLLPHLLETYTLYLSSAGPHDDVELHLGFLRRHAHILSQNPSLFLQQALNEPDSSLLCVAAQRIVGMEPGAAGRVHVMRWLNKPQTPQSIDSKAILIPALPCCVALSPSGRLAVVGTSLGQLHLLNMETGQEVRSLVSSCDGISGCVFLGELTVCSTSFDGKIEVWETSNGCRILQIEAHRDRITGCDLDADRKHLATVSLDAELKVWAVAKGSLVLTLPHSYPLNCVTFHPEGQLIATGSWDRSIRIWNWLSAQIVATLSGHSASVRSLCFAPSGVSLASGSLDGEVRLWSVPATVCLDSFRAHQGSTAALRFIQKGALLLSTGGDSTVRLWSGSLGQLTRRLGPSHSPALSVALRGDYVAIGYHSNGIRIYNTLSGELCWQSEDPKVSVWCLSWLHQGTVLVSGSNDRLLRVWRREEGEGWRMSCQHLLKHHGGAILALACSQKLLASSSDDFSVALWSVEELNGHLRDVAPVAVLRGHSAGVTCLSFSSDGRELLSGSKDRSLVLWDVQSCPPTLSRSFTHCHKDWITGCVWNSGLLVSSSNDCRVRVWDPSSGECVRELLGHSTAVSSVCSIGEYVMSAGVDGEMRVWKLSGAEITRISAHSSRINHCGMISFTGRKEVRQDELLVATVSDDGTVKLWHRLVVQQVSTLNGHSEAVCAAAHQKAVPFFLTVSEDHSLRIWSPPEDTAETAARSPPLQQGGVTALAFSLCGELLLSGSAQGELCVWQQNSVVLRIQVSKSPVTALVFISHTQFAVASYDDTISTWKLDRLLPEAKTQVQRLSTYRVKSSVTCLTYENKLLAGCADGTILSLPDKQDPLENLQSGCHILGFLPKTDSSVRIAVEEGSLYLLESEKPFQSSNIRKQQLMGSLCQDLDSWITAVSLDEDLVICGDSKGRLWFNDPQAIHSWNKKQVHRDKISALKITDEIIITGSCDCSVKLWDRLTKKQVGLFQCQGPVSCMEVRPGLSAVLACGDSLGNTYFIKWKD